MRSAECIAVVEQVVMIAEIETGHPHVPVLSELLAQRQVVSRVRRQVHGAVSIHEAGTVAHSKIHPGPPRQIHVRSRSERVALVVIKKAKGLLAGISRE